MTVGAPRAAGAPVRLALAAMGTRFEVVLHGIDPAALRAAGEGALAEVEACHHRFTRFAPDSLVSHLQRVAADRAVPLDTDTFALFEDALAVHRASAGAFDIAVAPLMDGVAPLMAGDAPRRARVAPARGTDAIELDRASRTLRFTAPGVRLDLGGIAKGHALDLAARSLRENGVHSALLHGGTSSVVAIGAPPDADAWLVALAQAPLAAPVRLRDAALAVSTTRGGRTGERTGAPAHIMDPRTGRPVDRALAVAVVGPRARLADAWATAIVVLGSRPAALGPEWLTELMETESA